MLTVLWKLYNSLSKKLRAKGLYLSLVVVVSASFEIASIAGTGLFFQLISEPTQATTVLALDILTHSYPLNQSDLIVIGALVLLLIYIISYALLAYVHRELSVYCQDIGFNTSVRLYQVFVNQDLLSFQSTRWSDYVQKIAVETQRTVNKVVMPIMQGLTKFVSAVFIFGLLFFHQPVLSFILLAGLSSGFFIIFLVIKKRLYNTGVEITESNIERNFILRESFVSYKSTLIDGLGNLFMPLFEEQNRRFSDAQARNLIYQHLPRIGMEFIAFVGILMSILVYVIVGQSAVAVGSGVVFALGGLKLLPAISAVYSAFSTLKGNINSLEVFIETIRVEENGRKRALPEAESLANGTIVCARNVSYSYPNSDSYVLENVNFEIKKGDRVAIMGESGSGKSTLIDCLSGLLKPTSGAIVIDSNQLSTDEFITKVAYVAQKGGLLRRSIIGNINIYGETGDAVMSRLELAIETAQLSLVAPMLTKSSTNASSKVAEELSGGQQQRVLIARALFREDLKVLILDEATSGLDSSTEKCFFSSLIKNYPELTVMVISHNGALMEFMNRVLNVENGRVSEG